MFSRHDVPFSIPSALNLLRTLNFSVETLHVKMYVDVLKKPQIHMT